MDNGLSSVIENHVRSTIGVSEREWARWPGGWLGDIESALIDAVFSARARYGGVHAALLRWQGSRDTEQPSLPRLAAEISETGVTEWAAAFGNRQKSPGRPSNAPAGSSKAATVLDACAHLQRAGIRVAADINVANANSVRSELLKVSGVGYATANYFMILLGAPGVKPDRMIHRFLTDASGQKLSDANAEALIRDVANTLSVAPHVLDHAIWRYESDRSRARTT